MCSIGSILEDKLKFRTFVPELSCFVIFGRFSILIHDWWHSGLQERTEWIAISIGRCRLVLYYSWVDDIS